LRLSKSVTACLARPVDVRPASDDRGATVHIQDLPGGSRGFAHALARTGLIASHEFRSPMVEIGGGLASELDREIERRTASTALCA
jgi:hypothetical protein